MSYATAYATMEQVEEIWAATEALWLKMFGSCTGPPWVKAKYQLDTFQLTMRQKGLALRPRDEDGTPMNYFPYQNFNKSKGTFTDWEGKEHPYNQTNVMSALRNVPAGKKVFLPGSTRGGTLSRLQTETGRHYHASREEDGCWFWWTAR